MIKIVFLACLAGEPSVCEERSLVYMDMPMMFCVLRAQSELALWRTSHPDWRVQSWSCRPVDRRDAKL